MPPASDEQTIGGITLFGKAMNQTACVLGELQRPTIHARVVAGLNRMRQQGKRKLVSAETSRRYHLHRLNDELNRVMALVPDNRHGRRLRKRYHTIRDSMFTFLEHPEAPSDNNSTEREPRPTATYRKVTEWPGQAPSLLFQSDQQRTSKRSSVPGCDYPGSRACCADWSIGCDGWRRR